MSDPTNPTQPATPPATPPVTPPVQPPATPPVQPPAAPPQEAPVQIGTFTATGNPGIDVFLEFASKHGLGEDSPEIQEAGKGNFAYLKSFFQQKGDKAKGYEPLLQLAEKAYNDHVAEGKASEEARVKLVHEEVGGEENWKQVVEWAKANAEGSELDDFRAALQQGGLVARATAAYMQRQFLNAGNTSQGQSAVAANAAASVPAGAPLTSENYATELAPLRMKYGDYGLNDAPEYHALRKKYFGL